MIFQRAHNPAKGCMAEVFALVGFLSNIVSVVNFIVELKQIKIPILTPILVQFNIFQDDPFRWGLLIFYGLIITMMFSLSRLDGYKTQPVGKLGAFLGGGFFVAVISPIFIYPFFLNFSISLDFQGALIATSMILPAIITGWILYHFFNR